jgi:hypothetical protein
MSKPTVTAAELRAFFNADPKRLARLSEAAQRTVREGARGRVHPEAIAVHNKRRKVQYVAGATTAAKAEARAAAQAQREALRAQGVAVGKRGPLPRSKG